MRAYNYIFYRFFAVTLQLGQKKNNQINAAFELTIVDMLLASTIAYLVAPVWMSQTSLGQNWSSAIAVTIAFYLPNHFLFIRGDRYKHIVRTFGNESKRARAIGTFIIAVVFIGVILLDLGAQAWAQHIAPTLK